MTRSIRILFMFVVAFSMTIAAAFGQSAQLLSEKSSQANELLATAQSEGHVRVIVMFDLPAGTQQLGSSSEELAAVSARIGSTQDTIISRHFGSSLQAASGFGRGVNRFSLTPGFSVNVSASELEDLAVDSLVTSIQLDRLVGANLDDSVPLIEMPDAEAAGATGSGWAVAVLDTGTQADHPFLSGQVIAEACFSNAGGGGSGASLCPNGSTSQTGTGAADAQILACLDGNDNICDHGTHVAGIAAGLNSNQQIGEPERGVSAAAKIFSIQVFTRFDSEENCGEGRTPCVQSYSSDLISAMDHVRSNLTLSGGVNVASANMSLGGGTHSETCDDLSIKTPIDALRNAGVLVAISSGNSGNTDAVSYPACISTATTVGSTTKSDVISNFSNMSSVVDMMAPGSSIRSSVPEETDSSVMYRNFGGTSMAAPHVAGAIAALRSACPAATATAIEDALIDTGVSIFDTRSEGTHAKPRIRVNSALQQLVCSPMSVSRDLNGDSVSDAVWRNNSGFVGYWQMNADGQSYLWEPLAQVWPADGWTIAGVGDFNGDARSDILWQNTGGSVGYWQMNPVGDSVTWVSLGTPSDAGWTIFGVGDFNGDGQADILWQHSDDGTVGFWQLSADAMSVTWVRLTEVDPASGWAIAAVGDFNGDGQSDILWQHTIGSVGYWQMNADGISAAWVALPTAADGGWTIAGVGNFNGDGQSDILWQNSDGTVGFWQLNADGMSVTWVAQAQVAPASGWAIVGVADFNGDGRSDVLWRNANDGLVGYWQMNADGISVTWVALAVVEPSDGWNIVQN